MKNTNILSHTKKYHNRKRVFSWLYKIYLKLNFWQKVGTKHNFLFQPKIKLCANIKQKEFVCYQAIAKENFNYFDSPLIVA